MKNFSNKYLNDIIDKISKSQVYRIVFLGDSITSTEWVHPNYREIIEYTLKDYIGEKTKDWKSPSWHIRTINSALDGGTTKDFLLHLKEYVISYKPDLVILQGTRNDFTLGITLIDHVKNIEKIIKKVLDNNMNIVFCGTTPSLDNTKNKEYIPYIKKAPIISKKYDIQYINLFHKLQKYDLSKFFTFISEGNPEEGLKPGDLDTGHPNQLGNSYIAKILLKDIFDIEFDPELHIKDTKQGRMFPRYK